ncbi:hypothetical protein Taro_004063 [Colocasia esculenta]|uniref:Ubiquitin-like domain-containing protein n=1 Tax=Colocasia esculenta TaxID=4460 RepID=A0A843TQQ1_COLES|nr:hypothetical protein [Colocasia esculenta]
MAGEDLIELKFRLFDGTDIGPSKYDPSTTVASLKEVILARWPQDKEIAPRTINDVKLINGGKILENNQTLAASRVPVADLPGGVITMHRNNLLLNPSRVDVDAPFCDRLWFWSCQSASGICFTPVLLPIDQKHSYVWRRSSWPPVNSSEAKSIAAEIQLELVSHVWTQYFLHLSFFLLGY